MESKNIKILKLEDGENFQSTLFRLEKGLTLRFMLGTSLHALDVELLTNYPPIGKQFSRDKHYHSPWYHPDKCRADDSDRYADIGLEVAGAYHFYLSCKESQKCFCQGFFLVQPTLSVGKKIISLDGVVMQTVLTKSLGVLSEWKDRLRVAKETGYNCVHFTPIQELGESNSSYSLKDQLNFNPNFMKGKATNKQIHSQIESVIHMLNHDWGMLSIVDVVWNHTANNSDWIQKNPESAYNLINSPHMRPAFLVDRAIWHLSIDVGNGKLTDQGIPAVLDSEEHLAAIAGYLKNHILPSLKLDEFFIVNVNQIVSRFRAKISEHKFQVQQHSLQSNDRNANELVILQDPKYQRFGCNVDFELALKLYNKKKQDATSEEQRIEWCCAELRYDLDALNETKRAEIEDHHGAIVYNIMGHIRYHFVDQNGPRYGKVTIENALLTRYFMCPMETCSISEDEDMMNSQNAKFVFAHQGWVMGGDALKDFAASDSKVYLRRELIAWGDSIKLRYGQSPADSPILWQRMKEYTLLMARMFNGFRIDNCHATPIHVAEYLLDAARELNPDLYVIAELFTNSEGVDHTFINRLGINSLIRERMSAHNARELGRLVYHYGGISVGSFLQPSLSLLKPSVSHALLMDLSHDNKTPYEVRSVYDYLPGAALVAIANCGIGSNRGYDELVPHHINVVKEERLYSSWKDTKKVPETGQVTYSSGMIKAKQCLNQLHHKLEQEGYNQIYVDQVNDNVVSVTRHCPRSHESVILVAHTSFSPPDHPIVEATSDSDSAPNLVIPGVLEEVIFEAQTLKTSDNKFSTDTRYINGLSSFSVKVQEHVKISKSFICGDVVQQAKGSSEPAQEIFFNRLTPGSVIVFKVSPQPKPAAGLQTLKYTLGMFPEQCYSVAVKPPKDFHILQIQPIVENLTLSDLNRILYRCNEEGKDDGHETGVYVIPNIGALTYCGLQGFISVLHQVQTNNDLGHPICDNLRQGPWMPDYISGRLIQYEGTKQLGLWLKSVFNSLHDIPRFLVPSYFDGIIYSLYLRLTDQAVLRMTKYIQEGSTFVKQLALGSVQMCGLTNSAPLPPIAAKSMRVVEGEKIVPDSKIILTMAAGLPHFSTGFMRCWGRDTFITLRGFLLVAGRFTIAKNLILAFGGCLRHGLIPNLLGGGHGARYNCRDAVWWWLQSIQDYTKMAPNGMTILNMSVLRMYPDDASQPVISSALEQPLKDVILEVMQRHVDGISFQERGAGPQLDQNMSPDGFYQSAGVNKETGFVFGGSKWNCGTWMDKMGESHLAGNWGHPATPRDGSAVEIIGLSKSVVRWLAQLYSDGKIEISGVRVGDGKGSSKLWTFKDWSDRIQKSFEEKFWIPKEPGSGCHDPKVVHRRGIYKDSHGASALFADYQLRPNFPIAMAVAPELFTPEKAWSALTLVEEVLLGPLGLATLDPKDWNYDGYYENGIENSNFKKSRGFNYHQGPEWVWVLGPFLRAKLYFSFKVGGKDLFQSTVKRVKIILSKHKEELEHSSWRGLPEITNAGGMVNHDGCPSQAWSMGCILELLYDMEMMIKEYLC